MRYFITFLLFAFLQSNALATIITDGQSYEFEFNTLNFIESVTYKNQGGATISFLDDLLDQGEVARLEFFENSILTTPFFQHDFNSPTNHFGASVVVPVPWQDLQGIIKLTMLSGSVDINEIDVQVIRDGNRYLETFSTVPIPEPETGLLIIFGLISIYMARRFFNKNNEPHRSKQTTH